MWQQPTGRAAALLLAAAAAVLLADGAGATVFSEGGAVDGAKTQDDYLPEETKQKYLEYLAGKEEREEDEMAAIEAAARREEQEKQLADELYRQSVMEQLMEELAAAPQSPPYEEIIEEDRKEVVPREVEQPASEEEEEVEQLEKIPPEALKQEISGEKVDESAAVQPNEKALSMHKKGQSEFVSFVDPETSKLLKSVPSAEKRKVEQVRLAGANKGGHLLFLAVGCVMTVGVVMALIGGVIRYRKNREEPDDQEYAPYAGTGPRGKKPIKGEKGDETLAYKAQLHHYQQAKQKIICGEENAGVAGDSDEETDEMDDENNFSVYECPGLAPTGDIEVHNPNFAGGDRP